MTMAKPPYNLASTVPAAVGRRETDILDRLNQGRPNRYAHSRPHAPGVPRAHTPTGGRQTGLRAGQSAIRRTRFLLLRRGAGLSLLLFSRRPENSLDARQPEGLRAM